jgi:hypothetical protein
MKRAVIGIASIADEAVEQKLPVTKIYLTDNGRLVFLERKTFEKAIALSLQNLEAGESTLVLVSVEIVPMSSRKRRGD